MKTVLITGCSSGYGLQTALRFFAEGWRVIATMRTPDPDRLPRDDRMRVVALDVTLMIVPDRRSRSWGRTARVMAITPKVLVSNTSRTVAIGVTSKTPARPMPALLTRTSMGPLASSAARMLAGEETSNGSTTARSSSGSSSFLGVRIVATTRQPWA